MNEWEEKKVVEALQTLFNIPQHWHFDLIKLRQANAILRNIVREGELILRDASSIDRGEFTQVFKEVYVRFLSGNEYYITNISLTDEDLEHLPKKYLVVE